MRTLLASLLALLAIPLFAGVPYLDNPTNNPGIAGQILTSTGNQGYYKWDWGTNAASSNATVVVASPSIGVTTNGAGSYTPFFSAVMTNWIFQLMSQATNESLLIGANGTNQSLLIGANATNSDNFTSNKLWLQITNVYVAAGAGGSTNVNGQNILYTVVPGTGSGGSSNAFNTTQFSSNNNVISILSGPLITNLQSVGTLAAGAVKITNASSASAVMMLGVDGSGNVVTNGVPTGGSVAAGVDILVSGSTVNFNTNATNIASISLTNGSSIGGAGANVSITVTNPNSPLFVITNSTSGSAFTLDTNGLPITQRTGETNGFVTVINALNFGLRTGVDGTAAIQAAIDAATNAGQSVYIPHAPGAGNAWTVNGTLHAGRNRIFGDSTQAGVFGTILFHNANNGAIIDISNGYSNGGTGVEIDHITFLGNGTGNGFGITATNISSGVGAQNFSIHDCTFQALQEGIVLWRSWDIVLQNNYFQNVLKCYDFSNSVNGVTIIGGHLTGPANSYGLYVQGGSCYQITVVGSVFELLSNAVFTTSTAESVDIHGCYFEGNTNAIVMNGNNSPVISGNVFIAGAGSTTTNIIMVGATQPTIIGNDFFDTPPAWNIDSTSTGISLINNRVNATAKGGNKIGASTYYSFDGTNILHLTSTGTETMSGGNISLTGTNAQPGQLTMYDGATNQTFFFDGTNIYFRGTVFTTNGIASFYNNKATLLNSNVGTGTWSFTNSDVVNWQCFIGGAGACAVQGVSVNDSQLFVGNSTNILTTVILQPQEWLRITNTTAPKFNFKRF